MAILPSPLLAVVPGTTAPFTQTNGTGATYFGSGTTATITTPDRAVLVWNAGAFNIQTGETFSFLLPSGGAVLNKVGYQTSGALGSTDTAVINGTLSSTGKVFVAVNGNISVGAGATLNTAGGLFLSTLVESSDFPFTTQGNLSFSGASTGTITFGTGASQVAVVGNVGLWGGNNSLTGAMSINNVTVSGDMIVNQNNAQSVGQALNIASGNLSVGGNLTVMTNGGAISQTAPVTVGALTSLTTNGNVSVTLTNAGNNFNTVQASAGTTVGGSVSLVDVNGINLGNSTIGGDLAVTAGGSIATTGTVAVTGNATLTSTGTAGGGAASSITFANNSTVAGVSGITATAAAGAVTISTAGNLTTGTISAGQGIAGLTLGSAGSGYATAPTVTISGGGGTGATAVATIATAGANAGQINSLTITSVGSGYTSAPSVTFSAGTATATTQNIAEQSVSVATTGTATINGTVSTPAGGNISYSALSVNSTTNGQLGTGAVQTFSITNAGVGYAAVPTVTLTGGGGTGAVATALLGVNTATGLTGGAGYTSTPTVTISPPPAGGTQASATATLSTSNVVNKIIITNAGSGYTSAPTITFSPSGSTTSAAAGTNLKVVSITATPGTGFTSAPTVTFSAGTAAATVDLGGVTNNITVTATGGNVVLPTTYARNLIVNDTNGSVSQVGSSIITTSLNGSVTANASVGNGNVLLTNSNYLNNATVQMSGNNLSVTDTRPIIIGTTNATGTLTVNTTPSAFGAAPVILGAGGGTGSQGLNIVGAANVTTNGSDISGDNSSNITVLGAMNLSTIGSGAGGVFFVPVTSGGSGYVTTPTVGFSAAPAGGSAPTATAVMANGSVVGIVVNSIGTGYTSAPTVTITADPGTQLVGGTTASATATLGGAGNVSITAAQEGEGGSVRVGQWNVNANVVSIAENTTINLGNITANRVMANSTASDILINGNVTTVWAGGNSSLGNSSFGARASSGAIIEGTGTVGIGGTAHFNSSNSFGTNLSNSTSNTFGGNVTIVNGGTDIIVSSSNITFTPGNVTGGSLTVNTIGTTNNTAFLTGGNATDVRINSVGPIRLNNVLVRNLTLNSTSTSATAITQTGNVTANGTVTITSAGNTLLNNIANNITGPVVLSNVTGAETTIYSGRNLTISGNSTGNLTAIAGTKSPDSFANTWNLILGNLNVAGLNAGAMNGNSTQSGSVASINLATSSGGLPVGGTGYGATVPTVTLSAPPSGGTQATAVATTNTSTGMITGIVITNAGSGYTSTPTITFSAVAGATQPSPAPSISLALDNGSIFGGLATEGSSGNITQASGARLHVENTANFVTYNGNIVVANNGNSNGRLQFSTGGGTGVAGAGSITYVEDPTVKLGLIATNANATITSRFGSIIEDPAASDTFTVGGVLSLNAPNGSVQIGGQTHTVGTTTGAIAAVTASASNGSVQLISAGNLSLGAINANSLIVTSTSGNITQSAPLRVFGSSTFNAVTGITLTDSGNNFGPITLNNTGANSNLAVTEAGTLNLRTVAMPGAGGNGTFTATSVNGDIIDTGLSGVVAGGVVGSVGTGVVTLNATNGNIIIDDPTTDFPTNSGVVFNAKNVTLSVLGNGGTNLVLGAAGLTSTASGNLTATSALGDINNAGNIVVGGDAFFQTGTKNITLSQTGNQFSTLKFVGNQVSIQQTGDMKIVTGSQAIGAAQLATNSGNITIVDRGGLVSFGNTVSMSASGAITLPKKIQAANTLSVNAAGTKDLSALSISGDLNNKSPINSGTGQYLPPQP